MSDETSEFPPSIGKVAKRELAVNGVTEFQHLSTKSERELLNIHGVGPKAVRILREELAGRGLSFRDD